MPLWQTGSPDWATDDWRALKAALLAANEGWEVWTDWYEARLAGDSGHPPDEALEIARATIPDEIWNQGPAAVNAEIKRLIEEHSPPAPGTPEADANEGPTWDQPDFQPILATRKVLRVLPLLVTDERIGDQIKSKFVLSVFHALAVAWARIGFADLVSSKLSVTAAREVSPLVPPTASTAAFIGRATVDAAYSAGSRNLSAAASCARIVEVEIQQSLRALSNSTPFESVVRQADAHDASDIAPGLTPKGIGAVALWPGGDPPGVFREQWNNLKEALRFADEGWDVWIDWYEARLDGRLRSQEVELAYVNYTKNVLSTASAWEANSEIRRLIDEAIKAPEQTAIGWDFFVSYAVQDEAVAREIVSVIEGAGYSTVAQFKDFSVGANFVHEMNCGLAGAGRVIALYSPYYQSSEHCRAEWAAAYNSDPSGAKRRLVPFLLAPTALDSLARQVVYKSLVGLNATRREEAILEAIAPRLQVGNREVIKQILAEVASPQASINAKEQLDAGPNLTFDRPFVDADLPELPSTQRGLANTIRKSLPRQTPPVVGAVLDSYAEHLLERGTQPIVRYLDDLAAALRAEHDAPEAVDWGKGLGELLRRFFANHALLRTHFPLKDEEVFAELPIDEDEATGDALRAPIASVAAKMQEVAAVDKATPQIVKAVNNSAAFANDLASLPPPQTPADPKSTRVTVKRRYVLGTIGFLVTIYNLIGTTASIYGIPEGVALLHAVKGAIERLMSLLL